MEHFPQTVDPVIFVNAWNIFSVGGSDLPFFCPPYRLLCALLGDDRWLDRYKALCLFLRWTLISGVLSGLDLLDVEEEHVNNPSRGRGARFQYHNAIQLKRNFGSGSG